MSPTWSRTSPSWYEGSGSGPTTRTSRCSSPWGSLRRTWRWRAPWSGPEGDPAPRYDAPMTDADVVVIGAGVMGAATARSLSRRGRDVVLLERFRIGHTRGSSYGRSRIFRLSYDHPAYVRMAMESLPLWRDLERETGREVLVITGGLDVGRTIDRNVASLEECGVGFELLTPGQAARRFPFLAF